MQKQNKFDNGASQIPQQTLVSRRNCGRVFDESEKASNIVQISRPGRRNNPRSAYIKFKGCLTTK